MTKTAPNDAAPDPGTRPHRNRKGWPYVKFWIDGTAFAYAMDPEILLQLDQWRFDRGIRKRVAAVRKIMEYAIQQPRLDGTSMKYTKNMTLMRRFDEYCNDRMIFSRTAGLNAMIAFVVSQPWPVGSAMRQVETEDEAPKDKPTKRRARPQPEPQPEPAEEYTPPQPVQWWEPPKPTTKKRTRTRRRLA